MYPRAGESTGRPQGWHEAQDPGAGRATCEASRRGLGREAAVPPVGQESAAGSSAEGPVDHAKEGREDIVLALNEEADFRTIQRSDGF